MLQIFPIKEPPFRNNGCRLNRAARKAGVPFSSLAAGQQTGLVLLYFLTLAAAASAQSESITPDVITIVSRMAHARAENRDRLRPYTVTREYKLFGKERAKTKAQVIADVSFIPPSSKQYAIEQAGAAGLLDGVLL